VNAEAVAGHPGRPPPLGHNRKEPVVEKKLIVGGFALLGLVALVPASARGDAMSVPGKRVAAISVSDVDLAMNPAPAVGVQLPKGKRKHMLIVSGVVNEYTNAPATLFASAEVNGVGMEPHGFTIPGLSWLSTDCPSHCNISGTWWLDLDVAEKLYPGSFVNQPLNVMFTASSYGGSNVIGKMSLVATLVKK
jgi:hypothetical protein